MYQTLSSTGFNFSAFFNGLATAMTTTLRLESNGTAAVGGQPLASKTFVRVKWAWIALPIVLLLGSLVLLFATVIISRKK